MSTVFLLVCRAPASCRLLSLFIWTASRPFPRLRGAAGFSRGGLDCSLGRPRGRSRASAERQAFPEAAWIVHWDGLAAVPASLWSGRLFQRDSLAAPVYLDGLAAVPAPPRNGRLFQRRLGLFIGTASRPFPRLREMAGFSRGGLDCSLGRPRGRSRASVERQAFPEG